MKEFQMKIIILLLITFLIAGILFNIYQYQIIGKLTDQVDTLTQDKNQLTDQVSELNSKINNLDSKVKKYLEAEGRKCENETETCLDDLINRLTTVTGPDCSSISDGICPRWCSAGSDYDCCVQKGFQWIQGRGCYTT
jgi:outer membrane murein-binding lipoprotein Lpp